MRKVYFDIEVLQEGSFPDVDKADKPIIMICLYDSYYDKFFIFSQRSDFKKCEYQYDENTYIALYSNEKEMLQDFVKFIEMLKPDALIGWNIIRFDCPYLINRMKRLGIDYTVMSPIKRVFLEKTDDGYNIDIGGILVFDLMIGYKEIYKPPSYSLKAVAELEGFEGKTEEAKDIDYIYFNEFERLIKYNKRDVELLIQIDRKKDVLGYYENIAYFVGLNDLHTASVPSNNVELMALRIAKMLNLVLPNKPFGVKNPYEGAYVKQPEIGLFENVLCLDFARLYPNLILTFNLSPETVTKSDRPWGLPEGLIPKIVRVLFKVRDNIEKEMKKYSPETDEYKNLKKQVAAVKQIINGVYGYLAYQRARLRNEKIAATITARAREAIKKVIEIIQSEMKEEYNIDFKVLYSDTDSVYVHVPISLSVDELIKLGKELEDKVTKRLEEYFKEKYGIKKSYILLEFEKVYERIFFVRSKSKAGGAKKRYAGTIVFEKGQKTRKVDITGFDAIRSNTPKIFKTIQEDVIKMILEGRSKDEVINFIKDFRNKVVKLEFPVEDYGIPVSISKPLEQYKANTPHVRAVKNTKKIFGIEYGRGDKVKFIWLDKSKNKYRIDVIAFTDDDASKILPEFKDSINVEKYASDLREKLVTILEVIGVNWEEIECNKVRLTSFLA